MFCSECGRELEPGARFCGSCGAEVGAEAAAAPTAEPTGGRRWGLALSLVLGAVVLVAVVLLLLNGLGGGSTGASNPEAAVREMASALQKRDMAAAIALVDPEETGTLTELYETVKDDLSGAKGAASGGGKPGIELAGLRMHEERMGPEVVKVSIEGGQIHGALAAGTLPGGIPHTEKDVDFNFEEAYGPGGEGMYVMTREVNGRWYVSPAMTALQYLVDERELAAPDFGSGTGSPGSAQRTDTPEKLLTGLAEAVDARDVSQLLDLVSNEEASAVRPYRAALQELLSEVGGSLELEVTDSDFTEHDLGGGLVRLDLTHAAADAYVASEYSGTQASLKLNGFCVNVITSEGDSSDSCDTQVHRLFGVSDFFVVARREDGGLRLAPVATLLEYSRLLADHLGDEGVRRATGSVAGGDGGDLSSGSTASGKLNDAGYAMLSYENSKPGLLGIEADQYLALLDASGAVVEPVACPNGVQVYALNEPGAYHVVVGSGDYRSGSYSVTAEQLQARSADVSEELSGTIGNGVRVAAFALTEGGRQELDSEELGFHTRAAVESEIAAEDDGDEYCAGYSQGSVRQVFGLPSLLEPLPAFEPFPPPGRGYGSTLEYVYSSLPTYLFVAGSPGTRFAGYFSRESF
jgi:hypothetical protein